MPDSQDDVPTVFADSVLGTAYHEGVVRIILTQMVYNSEVGAEAPTYRPCANLVMTTEAAKRLADYILTIPGVVAD